MQIGDILKRCFVEPEIDKFDSKLPQPASYIRKSFNAGAPVEKAVLHMTALGVYRGYFNGEELDEQLLTPGYTDYGFRVQYQSYDLTERICVGENVIGAVVGDGWYRGCIDIGSVRNSYGTRIALSFVLDISYSDGSCEQIVSDRECSATQNGPLRENNTKTLERYDATLEMPDWSKPGFDDSAWHRVIEGEYSGRAIPQQGEQVLRHERFTPKVLSTPDGKSVLDFGQNFAGMIRFRVTGRNGHRVSLTMGETLDENGCFTMKNLAAEGASLISGEVGQRLEYTLKDGTQEYEPHFLYCGFRYALIENWPEEPSAENFTGIAIYSDIAFGGDFKCSNEKINRLVENTRWSQKSNFVDIPGDCPTRERTGWTADIAVFSETACYLSDPQVFLKKWLEDFKLEQRADGNLPFVVPAGGKGGMQWGCMGWSTAIVTVPMTLYRFYGDKAILDDVYDAVCRFIDFNLRLAKKRNPFLMFRHFRKRRLILETGFHYGEWLEPGSKMYKDYIRNIFFPDTEVTTAWFYHTVDCAAEMAEILGKAEDSEKYRHLAQELMKAYQKNFLKRGRVRSERQCRYVRPLSMHLIPKEHEQEVAAELAKKCAKNEYRIGTGFLTTWKLLHVLTEYGYIDEAYRLLENEKQPGWLYAVTKGATTTWENWFGLDENGVPTDSHNHYAYGSVVAWLFARCAGIQPLEPGFDTALICPCPGGTLTWARATYESIHGPITSAWEIKDGSFELKLTTCVKAQVHMPNGESFGVEPGEHEFCCPYTTD